MASSVHANLLVACSCAVIRAASQAWSKALQNAKASGVHAEHHVKNAAGKSNVSKTTGFGTNGVSLDEAKKILPISTDDTKEQMLAKFDRAFAKNDDVSFYLQSKLFRAKETLGKEVFGMTEKRRRTRGRRRGRKKKTNKRAAIKKAKGKKTTTTTDTDATTKSPTEKGKKALTFRFFPIDSRVDEQRNTDDKAAAFDEPQRRRQNDTNGRRKRRATIFSLLRERERESERSDDDDPETKSRNAILGRDRRLAAAGAVVYRLKSKGR